VTAALAVLEATPSLSSCGARTAGILLQRRHVRHLPWMRETSEGDTQRVLASSPGPEVPVPMNRDTHNEQAHARHAVLSVGG
jgi:hypothetical protein